MAKKSKKPLKPVNWLKDKITKEGLLKVGFEKVKIYKKKDLGLSQKSKTTIYNLEDVDDAVYFAAEDVAMLYMHERWCLADSLLDSFWRGKLKTMGDVMQVLCLLSK